MPEFDLFDITGLPFDPPEKAPKKIKGALDKADKSLSGALGTVTQQAERDELNAKIKYLKDMRVELFGADGKLTPKMDELANARVQKAKTRLEATVRLLKLDGGDLVVTSGTIKEQRKKTKLSKESVEEIYNKHGFSIADIDPLAAFPKFPANAERIYKELAQLRVSKDPNPKGADLTLVHDLYAFAAYLEGEPENTAEYRIHETKELESQFDSYARKNTMRNDTLGKLCVSLATAGKKYVFDSEEHRTQYDAFLLYKSPELQELFSIIQDSIEADRREPKFANSCISKIAKVFPDPETALAIYNNEAGLRTDPYIPPHLSYSVKCGNCGSTLEFSSFSEAQTAFRCSKCNEPLFRQCKRCGMLVLATVDRCPKDGYIFVGSILFQKYIAKAEEAIRNCEVDKAWDYLEKAKNADPDEKTRTAEIERKIRELETRLSAPLQKLKVLISERKYYGAKEFLPTLIKAFPSLDISDYQKQINSALSRCQTLYESVRGKDQRTKVNACLDIIDICADYAPALEIIQNCPPAPCSNLIAVPDTSKNSITLTWKSSGERGSSFAIVRKEGKTAPANPLDGVMVQKDLTGFSYLDANVVSGAWYAYSVFAYRLGVYSSIAASSSSILYSPVHDEQFEQRGKMIHLSWTAPQNCIGVKVIRTINGESKVLTDSARSHYDDTDLSYNQTHIYMLIALYKDHGESVETVLTIVPTVIVDNFTIDCCRQKNGQYSISWSISRSCVDLLIYVNEKIVEKVSSGDAECKISLPENGLYAIHAEALSGGKWIKSQNTIQVNTYAPCELDLKSSKLSEEQTKSSRGVSNVIHFSLKLVDNIPSFVVALLYFVRDKKAGMTSVPWVDPSEINKAQDGIRVDISAYRKTGEIQFVRVANEEDTYYLTLYTVYSVLGKEVYSSPYKRKFNRPLTADIFWKVVKPLFGKRRFIYDIKANRPFVRRPRMILRASISGRPLMSASDNEGVTILDLPEQFYDTASPVLQEIYEPAGLAQLEKNTKLFLFIEQDSVSEIFTARWADGFEGKV